jgi:hypothetical protein
MSLCISLSDIQDALLGDCFMLGDVRRRKCEIELYPIALSILRFETKNYDDCFSLRKYLDNATLMQDLFFTH